jgi:PucR-like helix-turn-helix protein/diguanylate cyclase with GGDEF domain
MAVEDEVSREQLLAKLRTILSENREEIESALIARMKTMGREAGVPVSAEALAAVRPSASESLSTMIESFEQGEDWEPALPPGLIAQLKLAARQGLPLEWIVRGMGTVGAVFLDAMGRRLSDREASAAMRYMGTWQSRNSDRVTAAFVSAYTEELERLEKSPTYERREKVRELIEGGPIDLSALDYRLDRCHIGLVASGEKADVITRHLAERLGCELLIVPDAEHAFWAWLGASRRLSFSDLEEATAEHGDRLAISAGEPREGAQGWRLSHLEAEAAAPVAALAGSGLVRHSNVVLLASALREEKVGDSLIGRYLTPLDRHRDADDLKNTLRTYFELSCNAASTASALDVNRHTVQRRLRRVEEAIGEPPSARHAEFSVALQLERLTAVTHRREGARR